MRAGPCKMAEPSQCEFDMRAPALLRPLAAILLLLLWVLPGAARPLTDVEGRRLDRALSTYFGAWERGDAAKIVAKMPPRLLGVFAGATGVEARNLNAMLVEQVRGRLKAVRASDPEADRDGLMVEEATLADGATVLWGLLPVRFVSRSGTEAQLNEQPLLVIREGGTWYFLRIDGPEWRGLAAIAYPFLAGVAMPEPRVMPLR